jgi:hypothetical protein
MPIAPLRIAAHACSILVCAWSRRTLVSAAARARWPSGGHRSRREADCPSLFFGTGCALETPQHACRLSLASPSSVMDRRADSARRRGWPRTGNHAALSATSARRAKGWHIHGRQSGRSTPMPARAGQIATCGARVGDHSRGPPPVLIRKFIFVDQYRWGAGRTGIFA